MLRRCLFCLSSVLLLTSASWAARKFDLVVSPAVSEVTGYTKYVLDESGYIEPGVFGQVKSELRFPVGTVYVGLNVGIMSRPESRWDWSFMLSYFGNTSDPGAVMADRDWIRWPSRFDGLFSYTWSDAKMWARNWSIEARASVHKRKHLSIGFVAGFECQRFKQDLYNLDGWQTDPSTGGTDTVSIQGTGYVGYYSVTWKTPYAGLYANLSPRNHLQLELMAAFAPTWVTDKDIHYLRNRDAQGSGNGKGMIARIGAQYEFGTVRSLYRPFVGLAAKWHSYAVKGDQNIYWYGDDPATVGNDTGTSQPGVYHQMTSRLFDLGFSFGVKF